MINVRKFFNPSLVGPVVYAKTGLPTGVFCFGAVVDPAGILVGGIFSARKSSLDTFFSTFSLGVKIEIKHEKGEFVVQSESHSKYTFLTRAEPNYQGDLVLMWQKAASMDEKLELIGDISHFYVLGESGSEIPDIESWAKRMQDSLSSIPFSEHWHEFLWNILVDEGWAEACSVYGALGPVWMVSIPPGVWKEYLLLHVTEESMHELISQGVVF
jgi:hypothetical protein